MLTHSFIRAEGNERGPKDVYGEIPGHKVPEKVPDWVTAAPVNFGPCSVVPTLAMEVIDCA